MQEAFILEANYPTDCTGKKLNGGVYVKKCKYVIKYWLALVW